MNFFSLLICLFKEKKIYFSKKEEPYSLRQKKQNVLMKSLRGEKGTALLMAISFLVIMGFLVMEAARETVVEYSIAARKINKIKSYYAAKSGVQLSLLRLNVYTSLMKQYGSNIDSQQISKANQIWSFPLNWPLSKSLPANALEGLKKSVKAIEEKSFLKTQFTVTIEPQSTLIDINNLGSASLNLSKATRILILSIFNKELEENEEFAERYKEFDFEKLMNNITDWIDYDRKSLSDGRNEFAHYELEDRLHNREFLPPNQSFKTLSELHMVSKMNDELYNLLIPHITLYGDMGFNINMLENIERLSKYRIFKEKSIQAIKERLDAPKESEGGFFSSKKELRQFLNDQGLVADEAGGDENPITLGKFPFSFGFENFFRIIAHGESKNVSTNIVVYLSDLELNEKSLESHFEDEREGENQNQNENNETQNRTENQQNNPSPSSTSETRPLPTKIPTIVYWREI